MIFDSVYHITPYFDKKKNFLICFLDLIERTFNKSFKKECMLYLTCNNKKAFFTSTDHRVYKLWSCQNVCDALSYLLDNIYIRYGNKL